MNTSGLIVSVYKTFLEEYEVKKCSEGLCNHKDKGLSLSLPKAMKS